MRGKFLIIAMVLLGLAAGVSAQDLPRPGSELDRIIGKDARAVIQLLGPPRQDSREGPARRLQFANSACILDVYFYPPAQGQSPLATYTAARVPDGRDAERNSCISVLRMQR